MDNLLQYLKTGQLLDINVGLINTKSKVDAVMSKTTFSIVQPSYHLLPVNFSDEEKVSFAFARDNGYYSFSAVFLEKRIVDHIPICTFELASPIIKKQRRSSYRLPVVLDGIVYKEENTEERLKSCKVKTKNLSQEGVCFTSHSVFEIGETVILELTLYDQVVSLNCEILRCEEPVKRTDPKKYMARFEDVPYSDQVLISKFILRKQIENRKMQKLLVIDDTDDSIE